MRYFAVVSYDGTKYYGFQRQPNVISVQEVIEKAFRLMTQSKVYINSAGRTDKGVHAIGQAFHFDSELNLSIENWMRVNDRLPLDIRIKSIKIVADDFHARHSSKSKKYKYVIAKKESSPFKSNYEVYVKNLDIEPIKLALPYFIGTHDYRAFCQLVKGKLTIKTIYSIDLKETKDHYTFVVHGNSFLKYMVRSMMGTLIEIGLHKKQPTIIKEMLETQDRQLAGKTAESRGLYLQKIYY